MKIKNMKNGREGDGEHGAVRPTPHAGQLAGLDAHGQHQDRRRAHREECEAHRRVVIRVHRAGPHRVSLPGSVRPPSTVLGTRGRLASIAAAPRIPRVAIAYRIRTVRTVRTVTILPIPPM